MSIVGDKVQFKEGTKEEYESLQEKDPATFYYTSDTNEVFIGENQLGNVWHEVGSTPQPAVTEFTIDAQADLEKHWSDYSVYGGLDYALNLTLGDQWKCEYTYEGQTQELPNITVIKCSDAGVTGALADNLCLADDSLGVVIDKAESAFDGNDMWQPVYNEHRTAMDIMGVMDEEGQILPVTLKFTKLPTPPQPILTADFNDFESQENGFDYNGTPKLNLVEDSQYTVVLSKDNTDYSITGTCVDLESILGIPVVGVVYSISDSDVSQTLKDVLWNFIVVDGAEYPPQVADGYVLVAEPTSGKVKSDLLDVFDTIKVYEA